MGNDFKLFSPEKPITLIYGGHLFPVRGTVQGFTLNSAQFKFTSLLSAVSLPELQPRGRCDH